ncbi:sigma-70 family RNA polymerase sigma factor [Acrocarpospora sp. B8E8]|uniref:sigma-70 family RNA polymerase sigma factor n=1 Tax=Acrocarpospora sp. B8E8 TaxID=3153572 RepID=UPI00325CE3B8
MNRPAPTTRVDEDFDVLAGSFRPELLAHCYRMLGSVHDAEDVVQDTFLRALRFHETFEGRASMRTWLYRIATNACLTALNSRRRQPLSVGLGGPGEDRRAVVTWLEPIPDAMISPGDPATIVTDRASIRLAFIAALQHLPAQQRAVLILRDVLRWRAAEVAETLGTTTTAVNSALRRARARLDEIAPDQDEITEPTAAGQRELLARYATAFERKDMNTIAELLSGDAIWEMPPTTLWFQGPHDIVRHLAGSCPAGPGDLRLVATQANGQPAFATYLPIGGHHMLATLQVLTLTTAGISRIVAFSAPEILTTFALPQHR